MQFELVRKYLVESLGMNRKTKRIVDERFAEGICLRDGCGKPHYSRGICQQCKNEYDYLYRTQPNKVARLEFEQKCIDAGQILPSYEHRSRKRRSKNSFAVFVASA